MLIIGNGLSTRYLAHVGFQNLPPYVDTFGMGAAYRYFRDIDWWPTYYALCDKKVVHNHRDELKGLIENPAVTVSRFFFSLPISDHERLTVIEHQSTGDFCVRTSAEMGYRQVFLIGIDNNHIERIKEARPLTEDEFVAYGFDQLGLDESLRDLLIITETPVLNTNYFFDQYQIAGDIYSLPRGKSRHYPRWQALRRYAAEHKVKIFNLSDISELDIFPKVNIDAFLNGEVITGSFALSALGPQYEAKDEMTLNEVGLVHHLYANGHIEASAEPVMFDVGAHRGDTLKVFLNMDWQVHAFEPDPTLHPILEEQFGSHAHFQLTPKAISDSSAESVTFYRSPESPGVSSLSPFLRSHAIAARVATITLADYIADTDVTHIDFLKIDAEGHDLMVLQGFPWENQALHPSVIVCEFEDSKTKPLGYNYHQMAQFLQNKGYHVLVSEWHPIIAYGSGLHTWHGMAVYPCELDNTAAWGNLIAFNQLPDEAVLIEALAACVKEKKPKAPQAAKPPAPTATITPTAPAPAAPAPAATNNPEPAPAEPAATVTPAAPAASASAEVSLPRQLLNRIRGPQTSLLITIVASVAVAGYGLTGWFASQFVAPLALAPLLWSYHRRATRSRQQQATHWQNNLQSELKQRLIFQKQPISLVEAVAVINRQGMIVQTSERMARTLDYDPRQGQQLHYNQFITNAAFKTAFNQVAWGGEKTLKFSCGIHDDTASVDMQLSVIEHNGEVHGVHLHIWGSEAGDYRYRHGPQPRPVSTASLLKTMRHLLPAAIPAPAHPDINPVAVKCRTDPTYASSFYPNNTVSTSEPDTGETLYMLARLLKPENVIEVGGHVGAATIVMAQALEDNQQGMLYTVNLEDEHCLLIERHVAEAGLTHRVQVYQSDSVEAVTRHKLPPGEVIFIDGDHSYDGAKRDFEAYIPLLAKNGVMIYHDTIKIMALRRLMGEIAGNPAYETLTLASSDGDGITLIWHTQA